MQWHSLYTSKVMLRPRSDPHLLFETKNIQQICTKKKYERSAFSSRIHARALAASLLRQNHVSIATEQLVGVHTTKFEETLGELDSTEEHTSVRTKPNPVLM